MRKGLSLPQHSPLISLAAMILATIFLAGCGFGDQHLKVINDTSYTFCKIVRFPDRSINAPWSGKITKVKLPPGESISIKEDRETFLIDIFTCDDRFVITKQPFDRNESGDSWILANEDLIDRTAKYEPTPKPTRMPAMVTIKNRTEKDICSLRLSPPKWMGYQFGENILNNTLRPGAQMTLHEPEQIKYATYAIGVGFCDGTEYITKEATFADIMTITLRGEEQDTRDLLVEREEAK